MLSLDRTKGYEFSPQIPFRATWPSVSESVETCREAIVEKMKLWWREKNENRRVGKIEKPSKEVAGDVVCRTAGIDPMARPWGKKIKAPVVRRA